MTETTHHAFQQSPQAKRGFTLIELLVVVSVIAVLIAILVPALEAAIYQAELTVCAANQRAIAGGALVYAAGAKRHYPVPSQGRVASYQPDSLGLTSFPQYDVRRAIKGYIDLDALLCPLTEEVPLAPEDNLDNTIIYCNFDLWFGWRYAVNGPHDGMFRMGQRFSYTPPGGEKTTFRLLSGDLNIVDIQAYGAQSTHPDHDQVMIQEVWHDTNAQGLPTFVGDTPLTNGINGTFSRWVTPLPPTVQRGRLDLNMSYDDNSVRRFNGVGHDDPRMVRVPTGLHTDTPGGLFIPAD